MASKLSKNMQEGDEGGIRPDERNDNDNDDDVSTSSEDSSAESSPPESMSGDQIRKNARELLLSTSPDRPSRPPAAAAISASGYQSYHDASPARVPSSSQFISSSDTTGANPPWSTHGESSNENVEGLSMTDVASLAFSCVTHCLTEGYRAASTYYSDHPDQGGQYPSVSGPNTSQKYQQVGGYCNDNISSSDGIKHNGYGDSSYQTNFSDDPSGQGEVMDRGLSQIATQSSGQETEQAAQQGNAEQKKDWATVQVPSTYQGGRVGGGN